MVRGSWPKPPSAAITMMNPIDRPTDGGTGVQDDPHKKKAATIGAITPNRPQDRQNRTPVSFQPVVKRLFATLATGLEQEAAGQIDRDT